MANAFLEEQRSRVSSCDYGRRYHSYHHHCLDSDQNIRGGFGLLFFYAAGGDYTQNFICVILLLSNRRGGLWLTGKR